MSCPPDWDVCDWLTSSWLGNKEEQILQARVWKLQLSPTQQIWVWLSLEKARFTDHSVSALRGVLQSSGREQLLFTVSENSVVELILAEREGENTNTVTLLFLILPCPIVILVIQEAAGVAHMWWWSCTRCVWQDTWLRWCWNSRCCRTRGNAGSQLKTNKALVQNILLAPLQFFICYETWLKWLLLYIFLAIYTQYRFKITKQNMTYIELTPINILKMSRQRSTGYLHRAEHRSESQPAAASWWL